MKGYRKPLEMEDIWDLRDADKTEKIFGSFDKHMASGVRKAQRKLEIRQRKKKRPLPATDYRNGLSKAQSQDVLVLVNRPWKTLHFAFKRDNKCMGGGVEGSMASSNVNSVLNTGREREEA